MSDGIDSQEVTTEAKASESTSAKKPYASPKLRHLGSVRDLTLGSGASIIEESASSYIRVEERNR